MVTEMDKLFDQLQELTALHGVSGCEQEVVKALKEKFLPLSDQVLVDSFGNLSALKRGNQNGPRFMISAHSDEVGCVVTHISRNGFLGVCPVGVIDPRILPGTRMVVDQRITGTVVCVPGHTSTNQNEFSKNLLLDIGAKSDVQVQKLGISVGSTASFSSPLTRTSQSDRVIGKAIDNRVGCAILLQLFEQLQGKDFPGELFGVVTVQEEIGMMGARMIAHRIHPDFAIVLDTVPLDDTPLNSMPDVPITMGAGPVIQLRTGKNSVFIGCVAHKKITDLLVTSAQDLDLPLQQTAAYGKWVTDADAIHQSQDGIPTSFLSIPRRYGHTPNEIADLGDVRSAIEILVHLVEKKVGQFNANYF